VHVAEITGAECRGRRGCHVRKPFTREVAGEKADHRLGVGALSRSAGTPRNARHWAFPNISGNPHSAPQQQIEVKKALARLETCFFTSSITVPVGKFRFRW
jgi:hypothetical protein